MIPSTQCLQFSSAPAKFQVCCYKRTVKQARMRANMTIVCVYVTLHPLESQRKRESRATHDDVAPGPCSLERGSSASRSRKTGCPGSFLRSPSGANTNYPSLCRTFIGLWDLSMCISPGHCPKGTYDGNQASGVEDIGTGGLNISHRKRPSVA
jgi:hypothetical protein